MEKLLVLMKRKKLQQEAKSKGYSNAFIVAFKDGKSISINDAVKQ